MVVFNKFNKFSIHLISSISIYWNINENDFLLTSIKGEHWISNEDVAGKNPGQLDIISL
jgi:hypothetical protein